MSIKKLAVLVSLLTLPLATASHAKPDPHEAAADKTRADIKAAFGFVPGFFDAASDAVLPGAWKMMSGYQMNPKTKLSAKVKELIGLGVASQIPCHFCTHAHREFGKLSGATEQELKEAVAMAALTRLGSTMLNGLVTDETTWRTEVNGWVAHVKNPSKRAMPKPADPVEAEVLKAFGSVPDFFKKMPASARAGAWAAMRDQEMSDTALDAKTKSLIGIAVAAQIPCRYCLIADTAFARLGGATDEEIAEAITMAAVTRFFSTILNGGEVEMQAFEADVAKLVEGAKKKASKSK